MTTPDLVARCPFCSASCAKVTTASELNDEDEPYEHSESYAVICDAHMPNGPGGCGASSGFFDTATQAVVAWNRRPAAPLPPQSPADTVPVPTNADQAALMALLGEAWLREHAPERLRAPQSPAERADISDERIEALAVEHEAFGFGRADFRGLSTHGFDPEGLRAFARAVLAAQPSASTVPSPEQEDEPLDLISYNKGWDAAIQSMRQVAAHVVEASATGAERAELIEKRAQAQAKMEEALIAFQNYCRLPGVPRSSKAAAATVPAMWQKTIKALDEMLAAPTAPAPQPAQGDGYTPADFACWILDHHPAETTNRESIQRWLAEYDAECAAPAEPQRRGGTSQASGLTDEQIEALIHGLTGIKNQRWFTRGEVVAILAATKEAP